MKKITKLLALMFCIVLTVGVISATASAARVVAGGDCGENVTWKLTDDGTLTISGTGSMTAYPRREIPWDEYRTQIALVVVEEGITYLSDFAFYDCPKLADVQLPEGLRSVGWSAFELCTALREITFPSSFINLQDSALSRCYSMKSVVFKGDAPQMESNAFLDTVTTVYYPADNDTWDDMINKNYEGSLTWVTSGTQLNPPEIIDYGECGDSAVWEIIDDGELVITGQGTITSSPWKVYRDKIRSVVIGDGITEICKYAFYNCQGLRTVSLPDSLTAIRQGAFFQCDSLEIVHLPSSLKIIESRAFTSCDSLYNISIPASVELIGSEYGSDVFRECFDLFRIDVAEKNPNYASDEHGVLYSKDMTTLIEMPSGFRGAYNVPSNVKSILPEAFGSCIYLTDITLPQGITVIDAEVFAVCAKLKSIVIPEGVTTIGDSAFKDCFSLSDIKLPDSLTVISDDAFNGCESFSEFFIPKNVESIGSSAFRWCYHLSAFNVDENNANYKNDDCGALLSKDGSRLIVVPCGTNDEYTVPESVKTIEPGAFSDCTVLKRIVIHPGVTDIGSSFTKDTFINCWELTNINVHKDNLKYSSDENGVLYNKDKSVLLFVPGGYEGTFTIPASVKKIYRGAFAECLNLTEIISESENFCTDKYGVLYDADKTTLIKAPITLSGSYVIPEGVTSCAKGAFLYCTSLESVVLPDGIEKVGFCAFDGCIELSSIVFLGNPPIIDEDAFHRVSAEVLVPVDNENWTEANTKAYGGTLRWKAVNFTGDVNVDGELTNADLILVARYVVRLIDVFTPGYINVVRFGDMNDDGNINNADIIIIARIIVGLR